MNPPVKARRQHPIGRHITDFAIPACKLVIEIDGGQHARAVEADAERTRTLNAHGYRVIRFWNNDDPIQFPEAVEHFVEGLRKAGVPE